MKRLFALRNTQTNKIVADRVFSDKKTAKKARDELNTQADAQIYIITPGPDHWKNADEHQI